jgi:tRNA modification GTPase
MEEQGAHASLITPPGEGGIGIVSLWGPGALEVLEQVFVGSKRRAGQIPSGAIAHGTIRRAGEVLDEVIVARLEPEGLGVPEPYFEVNCHGGIMAVQAVLRRLEEAGTTVVDSSELSALSPAESGPLSGEAIRVRALAQLPRAPTRLAAAMLLHQAEGALSRELADVAELLDARDGRRAATELHGLLATARLGRALLAPPKVALLGPPNVGKSTLLNALLEEERVIVHQEPGTTRDVVAETVSLGGVPFELLDSAGIREAEDDVEREAVGRAARLAGQCEVALLIFDAREGPARALDLAPTLRADARVILVGNKVDLLPDASREYQLPDNLADVPVLCISAQMKANLRGLESMLLEPYENLIERCRCGKGVLFDTEAEGALRGVLESLATSGSQAALSVLRAAGV